MIFLFLYIISSAAIYFIIGVAYQGYVNGVNKSCDYDHWLHGLELTPFPFFFGRSFWRPFLLGMPMGSLPKLEISK